MSETEEKSRPRQVFICQGRTCRRLGSRQVLEAFQAEPIPGIEVIGSGCLGECGNGPMVLAMPDHIWYWRVRPEEVSPLIEQHLFSLRPIVPMLYPKFHSRWSNSDLR